MADRIRNPPIPTGRTITQPDTIREVFAWIVTDQDGRESVPAYLFGASWAPFWTADPGLVEKVSAIAAEMARESGRKIELVRFTGREHIRTIE